ncbi:MAG: MFS transporter [Bacteroidetes bacterium]|nr:MFS transporter [Bacteroidota bacterium]
MVGLERTLLPQIAEQEFHIAAKSAIFSFIIVFGIVKAFSNFVAGQLASKIGKKNLQTIGWLFALPVPFLLMWAPSWSWIIIANVFLGINQGLTWSVNVMMKIDLAGEENRGLAMGLNEFAGYFSISIVAFLTGWIAAEYGLRPYPFYLGIVMAFAGFLISIFVIKDTHRFVQAEATQSTLARMKSPFLDTTFRDKNISAVTQAGLINNLNDGMVWGLLPLLLIQKSFSLSNIGIVVAVYPAVWGISQLITGKLADFFCKKSMLSWGMFLQGIALILLSYADGFCSFVLLMALLGWGTAMVYPSFLATVAENAHPLDRDKSMGIFRLWRDLGYAIGALLTGIIADLFNLEWAILAVATLTLLSALVVEQRMFCRVKAMKITPWLLSLGQKKSL